MMNTLIGRSQQFFSALMLATMLLAVALLSSPAHAEETIRAGESALILQAFNEQHQNSEHDKSISVKTKQQIMFLMGVALLTLVLITGGLGLALGIYGKQVFVAHMVFAALSVTLGIAHAIVGLVWFYPF